MIRTLFLLCYALLAVESTNYCKRLHETYRNDDPPRYLMIYGEIRNISVLWGGTANSRITAAFITVALQIGLGYKNVYLRKGPRDVCSLSNELKYENDGNFHELTIHPYVEWTNDFKECPVIECKIDHDQCGPAGPRLSVLGRYKPAPQVRLFLYLALAADTACAKYINWDDLIKANVEELIYCKFMLSEESVKINSNKPWVILDASESPRVVEELTHRISAWNLTIDVKESSHSQIYSLLKEGNQTFLFLSQDVFVGMPRVHQAQSPPWPIDFNSTLYSDLDSTIIVTAASHKFQKYAPRIFHTLIHFYPMHDDELLEIMEIEARYNKTRNSATEAVCKWISDSVTNENSLRSLVKHKEMHFSAMIMLCEADPYYKEYIKIIGKVGNLTINNPNTSFHAIDIRCYSVKCNEPNALLKAVDEICKHAIWYNLVGFVVSGSYEGTKQAADYSSNMETPMILYDISSDEVPRSDIVRAAGASVHDITYALRHFLHLSNWNRIAAWTLGMTPRNGYAWILRESPYNQGLPLDCGNEEISFITLTNSWNGDISSPIFGPGKVLRDKLDALWPDRPWPPLASSIADAILVLGQGFTEYLKRNAERRYEIHGENSCRKFAESLDAKPVVGITQELSYKNNILKHVLVYVDEWKYIKPTTLAVWNVSQNGISDVVPLSVSFVTSVVSDNSIHCLTSKSGDKFQPHCHDIAWMLIAILTFIVPIAIYIARKHRLARLIKRDKELLARLLASRNRAAAHLATHLVERSAVEMREELGRGQFGRVYLAILRTPGQTPHEVAAKMLCEEASASEESEFLREACALASLDHVNIVKLVGICAIDGPPVVLMEHAKFGDLAQYLRARRPLAEALRDLTDLGPVAEGEAKHVTSGELSRLGREAAAALTYLATKRLVHRDIRAANCLIDDSRTLKLGDFGMVRELKSNSEGNSEEYECHRRGIFPVLWMAPEALDRGVFSTASDVWSLGLLILEIVTLGERPYSSWAPLKVIQYVVAGGQPPLPADVSSKTRDLLIQCCNHDTKKRASAADVVAFLALYPRALHPALLLVPSPEDSRKDAIPALKPESPQPDSGYGEEDLNK